MTETETLTRMHRWLDAFIELERLTLEIQGLDTARWRLRLRLRRVPRMHGPRTLTGLGADEPVLAPLSYRSSAVDAY